MGFVLGVDLGTSAVKVLLVDRAGTVCHTSSKTYPLIQEHSGYSEQDPEQWVQKTIEAIQELISQGKFDVNDIEGLSISGQMHGLVLLNKDKKPLRPAILWNDTRTTKQCREIEKRMGDKVFQITKNPVLEGFTLPKILWVKEKELELYEKTNLFLLPKDYLRYRLTGMIHSEFSDAAGTLMLDMEQKKWSEEICHLFGIDFSICPPLVESSEFVGKITKEIAQLTGLPTTTKVFAGGADNACGALGAGILSDGDALCSIGTSGVVLTPTSQMSTNSEGNAHLFYHTKKVVLYTMGVTLSAGQSLNWFRETFTPNLSFEELVSLAEDSPIGANGLLFTPYLFGERTPYADANIRGSFIGIDSSHRLSDFVRAVMEGITFSLNESVQMFRNSGRKIDQLVSIGGGAKSHLWLQMQADIFNADIIQLENEQGPGMGAAMLAAYGCRWFDSLEECARVFVKKAGSYKANPENVKRYELVFSRYQKIYPSTKEIF